MFFYFYFFIFHEYFWQSKIFSVTVINRLHHFMCLLKTLTEKNLQFIILSWIQTPTDRNGIYYWWIVNVSLLVFLRVGDALQNPVIQIMFTSIWSVYVTLVTRLDWYLGKEIIKLIFGYTSRPSNSKKLKNFILKFSSFLFLTFIFFVN